MPERTRRKKELLPFSNRMIDAIRSIPAGKVSTYGQVADLAGNAYAVRAVVWILKSSSDKYRLPWHRVISSKGLISLKPGAGFEEQCRLLRAEGVAVGRFGRISLTKYLWQPQKKRSQKYPKTFHKKWYLR